MRFAIFTFAWCGAVVWFWQNCVPVLPTSVIQPRDAIWQVGYSDAGEIVFCGRSEDDEGNPRAVGPLHVWEPSTGVLSREFLKPEDQILGISLGDRGVSVAKTDGVLRAIDLVTGRVLYERPASGQAEQVFISPDERLLSVVSGGTFAICDLSTGHELWSKSDAIFERFDNAARVTVRGRRPNAAFGRPVWLFDAMTGEPAAPEPVRDAVKRTRVSEQGDYAIVSFGSDDVRVCERSTGVSLWSLPPKVAPYHFRFSADGSQVLVPYRAKTGIRFARWMTSDGEVIEAYPAGAETLSGAFVSHDQRYGVVLEERGIGGFPPGLVRIVNGWGLGWSGRIGSEGESVLVTDYHSDRRYRIAGANTQPLMSPDGTGFAMSTVEGLDYYEFPPRRNWWWLTGWCILPPLVIRFLRSRWRNVKRRLHASMPTFFPPSRRAVAG